MNIIHIFAKDVRRMWVALVVISAMLIAADVLEVQHHFYEGRRYVEAAPNFVGRLFVPLGWIVLIAGVLLQERIQGTRQYWLTRPIGRWQLLGAKALFIAVFVNLLWLVSDCVILSAMGLPVPLAVLLVRQIPMTLLLFLPAMCLATIVANPGQFALGILFIALAGVVDELLPR